MGMCTRMRKFAGFVMGSCVAIGSLQADPVVWYRFDGTGGTVKNKANPGVNDATLKTIGTWGSLSGLKTHDGQYPACGAAGWPEDAKVMDVKTGTVYSGEVQSLGFTGDPAKSGVAVVPKSGNSNFSDVESLTTFTCEAFVKIPDSGLSHAATDILFPIVGVGSGVGLIGRRKMWYTFLCFRKHSLVVS